MSTITNISLYADKLPARQRLLPGRNRAQKPRRLPIGRHCDCVNRAQLMHVMLQYAGALWYVCPDCGQQYNRPAERLD